MADPNFEVNDSGTHKTLTEQDIDVRGYLARLIQIREAIDELETEIRESLLPRT